jgi:hypothetical protein
MGDDNPTSPDSKESSNTPDRVIEPAYRPSGDGDIVVYAGDLLLAMGADEHVVRGKLTLRLSPRPEFAAQVASSDWLAHALGSPPLTVGLPPEAVLDPPINLVPSAQPQAAGSEAYVSTPINRVTAGELQLVERLLLHVSGPLSHYPLPSRETSSGEPTQPQLTWSLSGWKLCLAEAGGPTAVEDFSYVVEAIPHHLPLDQYATERLCSQVFLLLSLIAGQEIGVAPVVGIGASGRVVWADWGAPRFRPEQSAWRWCPKRLVNQALSALATGLTSLNDDPALQQVVDRAGRHLVAANGPEVLDVRIPVACTGLELLSWAVLQRHQWLTKDGLGKLPASGRVRLLLHWASIPVELPSHFGALTARRRRLHQPDAAGPDLIFEVRNSLVHPPKRIEEPEWPNRDELLEAWQLATWYLELAVLCLLGYEGEYLSRLRLEGWEFDTETVPWSASPQKIVE